jgi:lipopolysaccharide transport system ATP-binding protein
MSNSIADDAPPDGEVLIRAERVSKKFCRSLKKSLWYGARDVGSALLPWTRNRVEHGDDGLPKLRADEFWAVKNVSFELRRGECLGIIGHNGAGKSTFLKLLNGLIRPDDGQITTRGRVAALIELSAGFNPILTGRENIYNQAALLGFSPAESQEKFERIVDFAEIREFLDMPVQNYSTGMTMRLGFAVAAHLEPDILIIDEVLAVGDVAFRFKCLNAIGEIMKSTAVVFVSHSMPNIFRICSEVMVLDHGNVTFYGRNVADGVAIYLSLLGEQEKTLSGSGEVQITALSLTSGEDSCGLGGTLQAPYGSDLVVRAKLKHSSTVSNSRVQFVFWNAELLPIVDIVADELTGYHFDFPASGEVEVTARVPRLELNAGKYTLSVIAESQDHDRTYCRYDNAAYLQVLAATTSGAHVLSVADWSMASLPGHTG